MMRLEAEQFFAQLKEFSAAYLAKLGLPPESPWQKKGAGGHTPTGAVLHYTANNSLSGTLKWFCHEPHGAKASSHVVISFRREPDAEALVKRWPLVDMLPVTVVQCVEPWDIAWHATWVNAFTYGIENVNAGELRHDKDSGKLLHWVPLKVGMPEWTSPWANPGGKQPLSELGRTWDNYPAAQVQANIQVLDAVQGLFNSLQANYVLGHEQVQGKLTPGTAGSQKRDPGPLFPLPQIREAVLAPRGGFLGLYEADPHYMDHWRERTVREAVSAVTGLDETTATAWAKLKQAFANDTMNVEVLRLGMKLLGYWTESGPTWTPNERAGVTIFQTMMGMVADGVVGPKTRAAIRDRLYDRGILQ